jgi:hypothetical protein
MTQPVTRNDWALDVDGPPPPPPPPAPSPASSSSGRIEGLPDPAAAPVRLVPLSSSDPASSTDRAVIGERLDTFLARATPTFRTPEGEAAVPIGFYMNDSGAVPPRRGELRQLLQSAGFSHAAIEDVLVGRGSPLRVAEATQVLIDAGKLKPPGPDGNPSLTDRIRQMNFEWSLGIDCAGYVALASLQALGISRESAGFAVPQKESLSNLRARGFTAVPEGGLRAGDIISLHGNGTPAGEHRAIVRDVTPATPEEIEGIHRGWAVEGRARGSLKWDKVVVDSSWGGGRDCQQGGVARNTWWYERTTGLWASSAGGTALPLSTTPYAHASHELFRPAVRR